MSLVCATAAVADFAGGMMLLIHGFEGLRSYSAIIAVCDPVPVAAEEQEQVSGGFSGRTHRGRRNQQHTGIGKGQRSSSVNRALIQADHIVATRNLLAFVFLIVSSHFRSNRCTRRLLQSEGRWSIGTRGIIFVLYSFSSPYHACVV